MSARARSQRREPQGLAVSMATALLAGAGDAYLAEQDGRAGRGGWLETQSFWYQASLAGLGAWGSWTGFAPDLSETLLLCSASLLARRATFPVSLSPPPPP